MQAGIPCTKCKGSMFIERSIGFFDLVCLQCGHRLSKPLPITSYPPLTENKPYKRELAGVR